MSDEKMFDPMEFTIGAGGGVPAGIYSGQFLRAEYVPQTEADPMTGKGGRQWASLRYVWAIMDGPHVGKFVNTETPTTTSVKSRSYQVVSWLTGKSMVPGESGSLSGCVGKKYLITVGSQPGKTWVEVVNAMMVPGQ